MSGWRCLICVSLFLTILLELTYQGPPGPPSSSTKLLMTSYSMRSTVVSRYAHTLVTSVLFNPHAEAHEAIFDLDLPRLAFISNFTMTINNKVYIAEIKEKHQAKKIYEEAHQQGKTAAHVGIRDRESEKFRISTSLAAGTEVTFSLAYEELLQRHQGQYQLVVSLRPGQLVTRLSIEVTVSERTGIGYVHVPPLRTSRLRTKTHTSEAGPPPSTRIEKGETCVRVTFCPTLKDQAAFSSSGIMADFVVQYDVVMEDIIGDVQVYDGYFIHYFAPRGLPPVEKNVVFVIDVSGSMFGTKMKQTKKAMNVILGDLRANDYFNIISFSDTVSVWKAGGSIQATIQNVHSAKDYLGHMEADGWTDINTALLAAASVLNHSNQEPGRGSSVGRIPLIIFLTDGEPTAGVTTPNVILSNVRQALDNRVALFSLAFGDDADFPLLRRLSLENRGAARRIYEDTDAALQLQGLYEEISMPLLADVRLDYLGGLVGASPWALFPNYFGGSELVVAGLVQPGEQELGIHLAARGPKGQLLVARHSEVATNSSQKAFGCPGEPAANVAHFIRRLWAYVTIGELLEARFRARDTTTRHLLAAKVLNLSLEYNFVTPLTSLVMVQPKEASEKARRQTSTTTGPGTIMPSSTSRHGLGAGTARPTLVPKISPKSRLVNSKFYLSSTTASTKKMGSSRDLEPLGQSLSSVSTPAHPRPKIPAQHNSGTLAQPTLRTKPAALVPSNSGAFVLMKPSIPPHQNPGTLLPIISETQVPPMNPGTPFQSKVGTMKHVTSLHSKPGAPSQPKLDATSHPQPKVLTSQSPKNLPRPRPGVSTLQIPKYPPHTRPKVPVPKTLSNLSYPRPGILLPKTPKVPSPLKPSVPPHQTSPSLLLSKPRTPIPNKPKTPLPSRPVRPRPPPPRSLSTVPSTISNPTSPSSNTTTPVLGEPIPTPFHPTLPSLLPPERLLHQHDLLSGLQNTGEILGPSVSGVPTMGLPNSSKPMPEGSPPNLPVLLPSSTLPEAVSLLILPEELELLSESMVESKFVESLNPPAFYTFLTPDENGNPHWEGNSEEILGGPGGSMESQGSSAGLAKGMLPSIFTFSSSVDGDPHFVVHIPRSEERICFTLDGRPGDLLQLIDDPKAGLHVHGQLLGAPPRPGHRNQIRTYFQIITVTTDKPRAYTINITRNSISVQGEGTLLLSWDQPALLRRSQLELHVAAAARLTLRLGRHLEFLILRHRYRHPSSLQLPHLGFYVVNGSGLSTLARGLLGQFQHADIQLVAGSTGPFLRRQQGPDVPVVLGKKLLKDSPRLLPRWSSCWLVNRSHVQQLLGRPYLAYVL
ncbi:Inter-alpha-trypsin inhibitor heavy chain H5-like protein [Myotis brandtii]|uniref:Inter-alpha-trypsin inhibitor heavy chain H5-like protein n=1 Tax=Myotis brandtii TaxID=109478 RepID=S7MLM7_MYOBR|nr:PREDICTED: inter-alpha-trypsin inhibitor heavy chain H6 [Myotis brandtii]EPQ04400.1 Inter-alpha-trypsin inhibitor heavy chain H5-like protein [Myotis brandtii]